ncbi:hypothetical protein AMAG_11413 [Allomyces macrogynus ATCC 38327]|uniref:Cytochrome P450 n=1 Tax=Allomyces macrogynus (strain ATCC 38327) TaxID=578462 RepID=A0A0L0SWJ2_ALLM3|nr:hypothetical protein AMAG_11413 [Allomyces macrogynus ATCC 38327]|eukprot:KNE66938.1 hypothetical protein AMAG_11413 [Allomyces macrogynus ATCC 38327]
MGGNHFSVILDPTVATLQALHDRTVTLAWTLPSSETTHFLTQIRATPTVVTTSLVVCTLAWVLKEVMVTGRDARKLRAQGVPEQKLYASWWTLGMQRYLIGHLLEPSPHLYEEPRARQQVPLLHGEHVDGWNRAGSPMMYLTRLFLGMPTLVLADPKALHAMLTLKSYSFTKPKLFSEIVSSVTGDMGMVMVEGDVHKRHRRIVNPLFSMRTLKPLVPAILSSLDEFFALVEHSPVSTPLPVHTLASHLTLNVIGRTAMNYDFDAFNAHASRISAAYADMLAGTEMTPWKMLTMQFPNTFGKIPTLTRRKFTNGFNVIETAVKEMLKSATACPDGHTLIHELLRQNEGNALSEHELVCEVRTFLAAGHETTASVLASLVLSLAQHPEIQQELRDEVESSVAALEDYDALAKLPLLNKVINETLRLYPPAYITFRAAVSDVALPTTALGVMEVPAGMRIEIPIRAIHLDPSIWGDDAAAWDPHRWDTIDQVHGTGDVSSAANRIVNGRRQIGQYDFIPFLAGPRACIGRQFSLMELRLFAAGLVQRYKLSTDVKEVKSEDLFCAVTMRSINAWVRFERRNV